MWQLLTGGEDPPDQREPSRADYTTNSRNAYLSKFGAPLPAISAENSPQPTADNQMIPYGGRRTQLSQIDQPPVVGEFSDGRVRQVEGRLAMVEQSNRALLEEVVRLQGELKAAHRRTEEALQAERQSRQQLTDNIRGSNDLIGQLGARLKRAEEKVADERTAVGALVNHTKQVEQAVLGSQQELVAKRDQQMTKIAELRNDLDEANRLREQLERATTTLVDELRQLKSKQDSTSIEYNGTLHDIKERTKRLEEEQRQVMEQQRKNHESQHASEQSTSLLRSQLDARLGEVRDVLMDLRNRVTTEETERRQQEQNMGLRVNELQSQINEQNRKRDESMHALDVVQREREHAADNERLKMQGKIAEIAEEVSRKILSKEIRLREEAQQKFANIEKYLHAEQAARIAHEQAMREENEKRWAALQKLTEEEVLHVREGQKLDRNKNVGNLSKVGEIVDKLEKQQVDTKKQLEQVMKAEIKSRQSQDKQIEDKIEEVQEKLGVAISTLQQAIGGINEQVSSSNNDYQDKIKALIAENSQSGVRGLADLDARMVGLQTRLTAHEESLDEKIQELVKELLENKEKEDSKKAVEAQQEQLEEINDWRDSAEKKLKSIRERMDELGPEIREMNRTNETIQEDMKNLVESEGKDRVRDVQMIRQEFSGKFTQLQTEIEIAKQKAAQEASVVPAIPISQKEKLSQGKGGKVDDATKARVDDLEEELTKNRRKFEEMKEDITKVDSSIQTVRVHLSRKIDGETKARRDEIQDLQNIFEDLKTNLAPLLDQAAAIEEAMKRLEKKPSRESVSQEKHSERRGSRGLDKRKPSKDDGGSFPDSSEGQGKHPPLKGESKPASRENPGEGTFSPKPPSRPLSGDKNLKDVQKGQSREKEEGEKELDKPPSREKEGGNMEPSKPSSQDKEGRSREASKPPSRERGESRGKREGGAREGDGSRDSKRRDSRRYSGSQRGEGNVNNSNSNVKELEDPGGGQDSEDGRGKNAQGGKERKESDDGKDSSESGGGKEKDISTDKEKPKQDSDRNDRDPKKAENKDKSEGSKPNPEVERNDAVKARKARLKAAKKAEQT